MDNRLFKETKKNAIYLICTQIIVTIIGVSKGFVLPLILPSVEAYAYWQIYLFYISYVLVFSLGFHEGVYLKYGGFDYNGLPFEKMRTSINLQYALLTFVTATLSILALLETDANRKYALFFVALNLFTSGIIDIYTKILQITNQMKKYSFYNLIDKMLFGIALLVFALIGDIGFKMVILVDFIIRLIVTVSLMIECKRMWLGKGIAISAGLDEWWDNIHVGLKLMIASYMSILITGAGRWIVEMSGELLDYAYYSFAISATNIVLVMLTAIGLVLYPMLKRIPEEQYARYYMEINKLIMIFNMLLLLSYFPICYAIRKFIPLYVPSIDYFGILICVVIVQCKTQLGSTPFFKSLRQETLMLKIDVISVVVFFIIAFGLYSNSKSITMIASATLIAMVFRCYVSDFFIRKIFKIQMCKNTMIEVGTLVLFIVLTVLASNIVAFYVYAMYSLVMCLIFRHTILGGVKRMAK